MKLKMIMLTGAVCAHKSAYQAWKHDLLEVPGYSHIHLEGGHHHHQEQPRLPDEHILEIQKASLAGIENIFRNNLRLLQK